MPVQLRPSPHMNKTLKYSYKGVAIFGAPGTGKTTLAKYIKKNLPSIYLLEAFGAVVQPAASLDILPNKKNDLFKTLLGFRKRKVISRQQARIFFQTLKNRYSPSVIAECLDYLHQNKYPKKLLIFPGVRGYNNALKFKALGYLVVFLSADKNTIVHRLHQRDREANRAIMKEIAEEEKIYQTEKISKIANLVFDTKLSSVQDITEEIIRTLEYKECQKCINSNQNPSIQINKNGLCNICNLYKESFDKSVLRKELDFLKTFVKKNKGKYDSMVGISGGKDSTATLYSAKKLGFSPLAFTFDTGYYPKHIFPRAKWVAKKLGVDHEIISIKKYIRSIDKASYKMMADLYDKKGSSFLRSEFRNLYKEGRKHYSVKCPHAFAFVRTCQLCRRIVIPAYYNEAEKRGIKVVILGMNEWTGLSKNKFTAIRKLKPFKNKPAVYVVHLPFLLGRRLKDTGKILKKLGWRIPKGEGLVESNSNSCLLARAAESKAKKMLGFHPDSTRLAREVTVGFIAKKQAKQALAKNHTFPLGVREVLQKAKIL